MTFLIGAAVFAALSLGVWLRPAWPGRLPRAAVPVATAATAVGLALGDAAPTGWAPLDVAARAGLGAAVVWSASRSHQVWTLWLVVVAAAVSIVAVGTGEVAIGVAAGLAGALVVAGPAGVPPPWRAVITGLALAPLGHLSWPVVTGASGLAVAVATVPLVVAGIANAPRPVRRWMPHTVSLLILLAIAGSVGGLLAAFGARSDVDRAVDAALAGLDQLDADDAGPALAQLERSAEAFADAEATLGSWWARPALLVPGVAQQARAVSTMADAGRELALAAATSLEEVDFATLRPIDGRIDLAAVDSVEEPLSSALASLRRADTRLADVRSPLLLSPVASRLEDLAEKVDDARASAETAAAALDVAPGLLGADEPRRYFLVMQTPSELRGVGGFMGSWGELITDDGRFELVRTGRLTELTEGGPDPAGRRIEGQAEFVSRWTQEPAHAWGLIGFSPDFPTVAEIIAQLYPQSGGQEVDGVIALDPAGFAALLELTGPISVPGYPDRLTAETAERVLLHDQYLAFAGEDEDDREAFLEAAVRSLFDHLTAGDLPPPTAISEVLAPMLDARRVQLFSAHDDEQRFFEHIDADGSVRRSTADGVGVVGQNFNGNKIDFFLRRQLSYDVTWDPSTGAIEGTLAVELRNEAPAAGLPHAVIGWGGDLSRNQLPAADGENIHYVSLYSALPISDLTLDDEAVEPHRGGQELGYLAEDLVVRIPSGATRVVRARISGSIGPGLEYTLGLLRQVTAVPDQIHVRLRVADGWRLEATGTATRIAVGDGGSVISLAGDAASPVTIGARAERADPSLLDRLSGR